MKQLLPTFFSLLAVFISVVAHGKTDVQGELRTQTRAGKFATSANGPSALGINIELSPSILLSRQFPGTESSLSYRTRIFSSWMSNERESLLLLHQVAAQHQTNLTRRSTWQATANGMIGEIDFSRSLMIFDSENDLSANRPNSSVVRFFNANANTGLNYQINRTQQFSLLGRYATNQQLPTNADNTSDNTNAFPTSHNGWGRLSLNSRLTRKDSLVNQIDGGVFLFSTGPRYFPVFYTLQWQHRVDRLNSGGLEAGATVIFQDQFNPDDTNHSDFETMIIPTGGARLEIQPHWNTKTRWSFQMAGLVSGYFDPILATVSPRLNIRFSMVTQISEQMQFQTQLLSTSPIIEDDTITDFPYPATHAARTSLLMDIRRDIQFATGVGANMSTTYPFRKKMSVAQQEVMVFASLLITLSPSL